MGFIAGLTVATLFVAAILLVAGGFSYVLGLLISGLLVGALGRLALPPNQLDLRTALGAGLGGSFLGGMAGWFLSGRGAGWALSVAGAAFVVWLLRRQETPRTA